MEMSQPFCYSRQRKLKFNPKRNDTGSSVPSSEIELRYGAKLSAYFVADVILLPCSYW